MNFLIVVVAMALGMLYNHFFTGFAFSLYICVFAGLTLVLPSLFMVKLKDSLIIFEHKELIIKSIVVNFIVIPFWALLLGYLSRDFAMAAALLLLALLPGGGMVLHWLSHSKANVKLGIVIFTLYLIGYIGSFYLYSKFGAHLGFLYDLNQTTARKEVYFPAKLAIINLVILPFIGSRILLFFPSIVKMIQKYQKSISTISIFIIIFYLFALKASHNILHLGSLDIFKGFGLTVVFYLGLYRFAHYIYDVTNMEQRAAFFFVITRYITIALAVSVAIVDEYGNNFIIPIISAYFIQIFLAMKSSKTFMQAQTVLEHK